MVGFADAIGLVATWPVEIKQRDEMSLIGLAKWARAYLDAGELLHFTERDKEREFYCGPVVQTVGLATELTLKTMLRGSGKSSKEMRKYSHNTYRAYYDARFCFDEVKFVELHFSNTAHLPAPEEVKTRLTIRGETDINHRWRVYFDHLRILDSTYDKPYRTRYAMPGPAILPETEIVLIGTKLLLTAMEERLAESASSRATP